MGYALYIRCALSIHQKECRKSLGCALYIGTRYTLGASYLYIKYIGARYLSENTVFRKYSPDGRTSFYMYRKEKLVD
jgi:hypothetical protein